eukprot:CAMPEP_0171166942 /NCGR_PEP_ID=MMETSP0790-20130122/6951_1 /TAXON_ID=2925 /ORGANISM="Alexandrium catenella, Strain OF101" /LENGTH=173 /DNA_ID=CAMNT_0011631759 /DNA_START=363 /DNA_END=884 /DNA_ORIENTATION=+
MAGGPDRSLRAWNAAVRTLAAPSALGVNAVGPAAGDAPPARGLPVVGGGGLALEAALPVGGHHPRRAPDVLVLATAAAAALKVHAVRPAASQGGVPSAGVVPVVRAGGRAGEVASRAGHARVRPLATEAALPVDTICEAAQPVRVARLVPEVGRDGLRLEVAANQRGLIGLSR